MALLLSACERSPRQADPAPDAARGDVVAAVDGATITRQSLEEEIRRRAGQASAQDVLEEMIRFRVLLVQARRAGYERDPGLQLAWERMLVAKFEEDRLKASEASLRRPTEDQVRAYYEQNLARFTEASRSRAGVILLSLSSKADAETRAAMARRAGELRDLAARADDAGYAELVRQHSEHQATRYRGGDAGWLRPGAEGSPWEPAVLEALDALGSPGDVGRVVSTPRGFHIVRLLAREPATVRPYEQVQESIRTQLARTAAKDLRERFYEELKSGVIIQRQPEVLRSVQENTSRPDSGPPGVPGG